MMMAIKLVAPPTKRQAALLRKAIGLRRRRKLSNERRADLSQQMKAIREKNKRK
jgi:hypothetical protein